VQAKDIIEQEVNRPGDMWRELKSQTGDISKAVGTGLLTSLTIYEHH
jgi:hypothetical protein